MISLNIIILFFGQMWGPLYTEANTLIPSGEQATTTTYTLVTTENQHGTTSSSFPSSSDTDETEPTARLEASPTIYLRNKSTYESKNTMVWLFAYVIGGILSLMLISIIIIVIWKYVTKRPPIDPNWAGRSPLADGGNRTEFPMNKEEPSLDIQRPSIVSITSLPGLYNKNQFLVVDYNVQTNGSKETIGVQHNHDSENQVNQLNIATGMLNKPSVPASVPTVPDGFETINNSTKLPKAGPDSLDPSQEPNLPPPPADASHLPDPSDLSNLPLPPPPESLSEAHENVGDPLND